MPAGQGGRPTGRQGFSFCMTMTPHPHQLVARDAILAARAKGATGFLLGDLTGLGKTLSAWLALSAMPEEEVLVICPKGAIRNGGGPWRCPACRRSA